MRKLVKALSEIVLGIFIIPIALIYGILYLFNGIFVCYELLHTTIWGRE